MHRHRRGFRNFDLTLVYQIVRAFAPRFYTTDVADHPAMLQHHQVAGMTTEQRYTYRKSCGKVLSVFRPGLGLQHLAPQRGDGKGSLWGVVEPWEELELD